MIRLHRFRVIERTRLGIRVCDCVARSPLSACLEARRQLAVLTNDRRGRRGRQPLHCYRAARLERVRVTSTPTLLPFGDDSDAEGWTLSDCALVDGGHEIQLQRIDSPDCGTPPIFADDAAAWDFVVARARAGSASHRSALRTVSSAERARIADRCGELPD